MNDFCQIHWQSKYGGAGPQPADIVWGGKMIKMIVTYCFTNNYEVF